MNIFLIIYLAGLILGLLGSYLYYLYCRITRKKLPFQEFGSSRYAEKTVSGSVFWPLFLVGFAIISLIAGVAVGFVKLNNKIITTGQMILIRRNEKLRKEPRYDGGSYRQLPNLLDD